MKVSRRDVQVGVGPVAYNQHFAQIVTYLSWIYTHKFAIFSSKPQEVPKLFSLLYPLPPMVWLCFAGAITLLSIISYILLRIPKFQIQTIKCGQMHIISGKRILIAMSLFTAIMFENLYTNSLESQLVVKEFEQPIDTIEDLLDSGLPTYYPGKTAISKFIQDYPNNYMREIIKSKSEPFPFVGKIPPYVKDRSVFMINALCMVKGIFNQFAL